MTDDQPGPAPERRRPDRRTVLMGAVGAAAGAASWGAPAVTRLSMVPQYTAAASAAPLCPGPVRMLGWNTAATEEDGELRADFIIRVPTGVSPTSITYRFTSSTTGVDTTATAISAATTNNINNTYRIVARTTGSPCDLVAISLQGDVGHPAVTCTTPPIERPNRIRVNLPAPYTATPITFGGDTLATAGGYSVDLYTTVSSTGCSKPYMRTPWDFTWAGYPAGSSSQAGWGLITTTGVTPAAFLLHPRNPSTGTAGANCSGATATTAGRTTKVWYQWVKEVSPGLFSAATALASFDGTNSTSTTDVGNAYTWLSQDFTALGAGYYKLLAWPQAGGTGCTGRVQTPGDLSDAWTIGSVFYDYVPAA